MGEVGGGAVSSAMSWLVTIHIALGPFAVWHAVQFALTVRPDGVGCSAPVWSLAAACTLEQVGSDMAVK